MIVSNTVYMQSTHGQGLTRFIHVHISVVIHRHVLGIIPHSIALTMNQFLKNKRINFFIILKL